MKTYNAVETEKLLPYPELISDLAKALEHYAAGKIVCPERIVAPAPGRSSLLMAMPATGEDILIAKVLTLCPDNVASAYPMIQGCLLCADTANGQMLFSIDGGMVSKRRTAAVSMLGVQLLHKQVPRHVLIFGTGTQALAHCEALAALYPDVSVTIAGRDAVKSVKFCQENEDLPLDIKPFSAGNLAFDVIIGTTSSTEILYDEAPVPGCLVIGVGAYQPHMIEFGPKITTGSQLYVDDKAGALTEAGDLIQANVDWSDVHPLVTALTQPRAADRPIFFKSVGCAAWDLAACRTARRSLMVAGEKEAAD